MDSNGMEACSRVEWGGSGRFMQVVASACHETRTLRVNINHTVGMVISFDAKVVRMWTYTYLRGLVCAEVSARSASGSDGGSGRCCDAGCPVIPSC